MYAMLNGMRTAAFAVAVVSALVVRAFNRDGWESAEDDRQRWMEDLIETRDAA